MHIYKTNERPINVYSWQTPSSSISKEPLRDVECNDIIRRDDIMQRSEKKKKSFDHIFQHIFDQIENGKNIVSVLNSNMNTMKRKTISNEFWSEQRKKNITDEKK